MTDREFDVLDELYFVISYEELKEMLPYSDKELQACLKSLIEKGFVRCLTDEQHEETHPDPKKFTSYYFLASKAGLLAHNSR